jgi:hypothetical protein
MAHSELDERNYLNVSLLKQDLISKNFTSTFNIPLELKLRVFPLRNSRNITGIMQLHLKTKKKKPFIPLIQIQFLCDLYHLET